jgi:hypothetical protein
MSKHINRCFWGIFCVFVLLATVRAAENEFVLQGDGRDTDMTNIEKNVSADQDLVITITGNSRYRMQSKGKFSLYAAKRQKLKEVRFDLQQCP